MLNSLLVYTSKSGATREVAEKITNILRADYKLSVDLINLKERKVKDLSQYDAVIVASGIRMDEWYNQSVRFLKKDLKDKKIAVFTCSGTAGIDCKYEHALAKYVKGKINRYLVLNNVVAFDTFGGRKYKNEPDGTKSLEFDNRNWDQIEAWAHKVGKIFSGTLAVKTPLYVPEISPYGKKKTLISCIFFGIFGVHRYKTGYLGSGLLYSFTLGLLGFGVVRDLIHLLNGEYMDGFGRKIINWEAEENTTKPKGIF